MHLKTTLAAALALALLAGCSAHAPAPAVPAVASTVPGAVNVTGAYRHDRYARAAVALSICVAHGMHEAHPEMFFVIAAGQPITVAASKAGSDLWLLEFHNAGAGVSEVVLRDRSAGQPALEEAWRAVEICGRQGS